MQKNTNSNAWTNRELAVLRRKYPSNDLWDLYLMMPRHTRQAIKKMASRMGLRKSKKYMKWLGRK